MSWTFELALLFFLALSAVSQFATVKSRGVFSLPFAFGVLFIAAYALNIIPKDFVGRTKLLDIGIIAYNVLIIHSGTFFSFKTAIKQKRAFLVVLANYLVLGVFFLTVGVKLFGKPMAFFAFPSVLGGGATSAIASFATMKNYPHLSFFPWMFFMFQGFFGIPLFAYYVKKVYKQESNCPSEESEKQPQSPVLKQKNSPYKGAAYYLGILMAFSFLNKFLFSSLSQSSGITLTFTALIFGIILGETKLIERGPLYRADCFGLLMLGLMSLMAESLAHVPFLGIIKMLVPVLIFFAIATFLIVLVGLLLSRYLGFSKERSIVIALSAITATPANTIIINGIYGKTKGLNSQRLIEETNMGSLYGVNILSVALISILVAFI
ncbi:MAG: hypothetical protein WDA17_04985 [Sphaerochaetaceae bacterium]